LNRVVQSDAIEFPYYFVVKLDLHHRMEFPHYIISYIISLN